MPPTPAKDQLSFKLYSALAGTHKPEYFKLWFYCRGIDPAGSGVVTLDLEEFLAFIGRKKSTVYQWLADAQADGAIRFWNIRQDKLTIFYSSLVKVCYERGLSDFGAVGIAPLERVKDLHVVACEIQTLHLQEQSRRAALKTLKPNQRKYLGLPLAEEILYGVDSDRGASDESQSSHISQSESANGFILHRGRSKVFVEQNFVPFGSSQASIAAAQGCSDRTVRNYLVGLDRKQIVQTKPEYAVVQQAIANEVDHYIAVSPDIYLDIHAAGALKLFEKNGFTNSVREGGHPITEQRFFNYFGKTWMYRNNIYSIDIELCQSHFQLKDLKNLWNKTGSPRSLCDNPTLCKKSDGGSGKRNKRI